MAKHDSTQAAKVRSGRFQALKFEDLVDMLETRFKDANEKSETMVSIAYGGRAHAAHIKPDGDQIDITSKYMFQAITDIGTDCSEYYDSQELIAEMRARLGKIETDAEKVSV